MRIWNQYIAGFEDVWLVLGVSVWVIIWLTARLLSCWNVAQLRRLAGHQVGATYMLPLVLTIPFYLLFITLIIESTLMLNQKIGSVAAAYSAARAAAVWLPYASAMPADAPDYTPLENRLGMVRLAAARAMFPFASGSKHHVANESLSQQVTAAADQQIAAYRGYAGSDRFDTEYLRRKFAYAYRASSVQVDYFDPVNGERTETPVFNSKLQLTLRYEAPIHTWGIGSLFGQASQLGNYVVRPITSTMIIENEGVKAIPNTKESSPSKGLGIKYYSSSAANP